MAYLRGWALPIYECARKHHAAFAKDLIAWCDLTASGFEEYRDGPSTDADPEHPRRGGVTGAEAGRIAR